MIFFCSAVLRTVLPRTAMPRLVYRQCTVSISLQLMVSQIRLSSLSVWQRSVLPLSFLLLSYGFHSACQHLSNSGVPKVVISPLGPV